MEKAIGIVQEYKLKIESISTMDELLEIATFMLMELQTDQLSPKLYYELHTETMEGLTQVEDWFVTFMNKGQVDVQELYEKVQIIGNILPRLYLLVTVGAVYIQMENQMAKVILNDIMDMIKGIQDPLRGLFLRKYTVSSMKDKLPDVGNAYEMVDTSVVDSVVFLLTNFGQANRLWIRMKFEGNRERERRELKVLVTSSISILTMLEGVDVVLYRKMVLPKLLEMMIECKDAIAQQHIMDCLIHAFPDEYHIATLQMFFDACMKMEVDVNIHVVVQGMLGRLAVYLKNTKGALSTYQKFEFAAEAVYEMLRELVEKLAQQMMERKDTEVQFEHMLLLHVGMLDFVLSCYVQDDFKYLQQTINACVVFITNYNPMADVSALSNQTIVQLEKLVYLPIQKYSLGALKIGSFNVLMNYLPMTKRMNVANQLLLSILNSQYWIQHKNELEMLLTFAAPLVKGTDGRGTQQYDFETQQYNLGRMVHRVRSENVDTAFQMLSVARKNFGQGGIHRIQFTLVPLAFCSLRLVMQVYDTTQKCNVTPRKVLQFVHEIVTALASNYQIMAFKLFLECAKTADNCKYDSIAYEFITQAFTLYDDAAFQSVHQVELLTLLIGTLCSLQHISASNYSSLITKNTQYAAKLNKKVEQCRMVAECSHLFWKTHIESVEECNATCANFQDGSKVLECLQRSLTIAELCVNTSSRNVHLFIDLLDKYIYFYKAKTSQITRKYLAGLVALIDDRLSIMDDSSLKVQSITHFKGSVDSVKALGIDV